MTKKMPLTDLKLFLDEKVEQYNTPLFIKDDPISIPHQYNLKEDIEIAAFLSATIAWGQRKTIINNAHKMMQLMGNSPYDFVMNFNPQKITKLAHFKHRTFNGDDFSYFLTALQYIYTKHQGLEATFAKKITKTTTTCFESINHFRTVFFSPATKKNEHTKKHVSNTLKGSAAKRINMFLRWMVREDKKGVDFGIWKTINPSQLSCPLDIHSGNVARKLGLLTRTQNDLKAVIELDENLRKMDRNDPVKYDFALFGLGVYEGFK